MGIASCQCRLGVGPGLDLRPDRFVAVGRDDKPVPAEVERVDLAVGVVALECRRVDFTVAVPGRDPAMGSVERCCGEQGRDPGIEPGKARVPVGDRAHDFCVVVLVHDLCGVGFAGLFDACVCFTCGHVRDTSEGIRYDDCLDDRIEGRRVLNRVGEIAEGGLGGCSILEVCHFFHILSLFLFVFVSRRPL